jgi:Mg2+/citrate symporter
LNNNTDDFEGLKLSKNTQITLISIILGFLGLLGIGKILIDKKIEGIKYLIVGSVLSLLSVLTFEIYVGYGLFAAFVGLWIYDIFTTRQYIEGS